MSLEDCSLHVAGGTVGRVTANRYGGMKRLFATFVFLLGIGLGGSTWAGPVRTPIIDVTDLYHPYEDPGDNFDLIAAYALPEVDLRAVILDCTAGFRKPVADHPGLWADPDGPRDPGFIPVTQLNFIFNRGVPCATGPFTMMKSPQDKMLDAPGFQQQGIELIIKTLRESREPVEILSFGSARTIAAAYNRDPKLLMKKVRRIHLSAGASEPGFLEWNVKLDPQAIVCLLRSKLPVAIYPCATKNGTNGIDAAFTYGPNNTFWKLPDLSFIPEMHPMLRAYLAYSFSRSKRTDFLRAVEEDPPAEVMRNIVARPHNVWETALWLNVSGRKLVKRADGHYRIVAASEVRLGDRVLPNNLRPCQVLVRTNGEFQWTCDKAVGSESGYSGASSKWNFEMIDRGNPKENEIALREALPAWYKSIRP